MARDTRGNNAREPSVSGLNSRRAGTARDQRGTSARDRKRRGNRAEPARNPRGNRAEPARESCETRAGTAGEPGGDTLGNSQRAGTGRDPCGTRSGTPSTRDPAGTRAGHARDPRGTSRGAKHARERRGNRAGITRGNLAGNNTLRPWLVVKGLTSARRFSATFVDSAGPAWSGGRKRHSPAGLAA
jgi:hypothetical protein